MAELGVEPDVAADDGGTAEPQRAPLLVERGLGDDDGPRPRRELDESRYRLALGVRCRQPPDLPRALRTLVGPQLGRAGDHIPDRRVAAVADRVHVPFPEASEHVVMTTALVPIAHAAEPK